MVIYFSQENARKNGVNKIITILTIENSKDLRAKKATVVILKRTMDLSFLLLVRT